LRCLPICFAIACLSLPALAQNDALPAPGGQVRRYQLQSGTTVILQNVPGLPAVGLSLVVPAGSSNDPVNRPGLCAIAAQQLSRQTQHHPAGSLLIEDEEIGARFGHRVLEDSCVFWEVVPRQHLGWALEVELERLSGRAAIQEQMETDFAAVQQSWLQRSLRGQLEVLARLFPGVSAAAPVLPSATEADQFRLQNFRPQDSVVTVVGSFDPAQIAHLLPPGPPHTAASALTHPSRGNGIVVDLPGAHQLEWDWPLSHVASVNAALRVWAQNVPPGCNVEIDRTECLFRLQRSVASGEDVVTTEAAVERDWQRRLFAPVSGLTGLKAAATLNGYRELDDLGQRAVAFGLDQSRSGFQCLSQQDTTISALTPDALSSLAQSSLRIDQAVELRPVYGTAATAPRIALPAERNRKAVAGTPPNYKLTGFSAPPFQRLERPDGATVLVQTVHDLPLVTVRGYFQGGSLLDSPQETGRTQLLASVLQQRFHQLVAPELELRISAEPSYLLVEGSTSKARLTEWLRGLVATLASEPQDSGSARAELTRELIQSTSEQMAYRRWRQMLYPVEHPWGHTQEQLLEGLSHVGTTQLDQAFQQICHLNRLTLVFSGELSAAEASQSLNESVPASASPEPPPGSLLAPPVADQAPTAPVRLKGPTRLILTGGLGPSRHEHDFYAFNLLNQVLGGDPVSSRLARRLIDKEDRVTAVSSRLQAGLGPMPWVIGSVPVFMRRFSRARPAQRLTRGVEIAALS
jgi:predicted Zn-dependent peptidase